MRILVFVDPEVAINNCGLKGQSANAHASYVGSFDSLSLLCKIVKCATFSAPLQSHQIAAPNQPCYSDCCRMQETCS